MRVCLCVCVCMCECCPVCGTFPSSQCCSITELVPRMLHFPPLLLSPFHSRSVLLSLSHSGAHHSWDASTPIFLNWSLWVGGGKKRKIVSYFSSQWCPFRFLERQTALYQKPWHLSCAPFIDDAKTLPLTPNLWESSPHYTMSILPQQSDMNASTDMFPQLTSVFHQNTYHSDCAALSWLLSTLWLGNT